MAEFCSCSQMLRTPSQHRLKMCETCMEKHIIETEETRVSLAENFVLVVVAGRVFRMSALKVKPQFGKQWVASIAEDLGRNGVGTYRNITGPKQTEGEALGIGLQIILDEVVKYKQVRD